MRTHRWLKGICVGAAVLSLTGCALLNAPPTAQFTWNPSSPTALSDIQFTDLSTDTGGLLGGGGIVSWLWDFGDSGSSTAQNPKHTYAKGGTYTVRLTVTDDGGETATFTRQITVTASLTGIWIGSITDLGGGQWDLTMIITHLASGMVTGKIQFATFSEDITSGSFNPTTSEVLLTSQALQMTFRGTLDASETRMSGMWYNSITMQQGRDWSVMR